MSDIARLVIEIDSSGVVTSTKSLKKFKTSADDASKSTKKLKDENKRLSSSLKVTGRDISRYITIPLTAASAASIKFGLDLNRGLGNVQALIPGTVGRIDELKEAIKGISIETGISFDVLTEGLYNTISAFQDNEDTVKRFNTAVKAGIAGYATTTDAVRLLSAVTKAYGDTSSKATDKVSDLALETVRLGQTTFAELASAIQGATSLSDALGVSQTELFNVFATGTGVLGTAERVATKYESTLAALLNPTVQLQAAFKQMGIESGKQLIAERGLIGAIQTLADISEKTGISLFELTRRKEALIFVTAMAGKLTDQYNDKLKQMQRSSGATVKAYDAQTKGVNKYGHELRQLIQSLKVTASEIGDIIIPGFIKFLKVVDGVVRVFKGLPEATQQSIIFFATLAAAIGPIMILMGSLVKAFELLKTVQLASHIAGLVGILGGPGGLLVALTAVSVVAGLTTKMFFEMNKEVDTHKELLKSIKGDYALVEKALADTNDKTKVNLELNKELIKRHPKIMQKWEAERMSIEDATKALDEFNRTQITKEFAGDIAGIRSQEKLVAAALSNIDQIKIKIIELRKEGKIETALVMSKKLLDFQPTLDVVSEGYNKLFKNIRADLADVGYYLTDALQLEKLPPALEDAGKKSVDAFGKGLGGAKKTWQVWFEEIAGITKEEFGNSGKKAGELFIEEFAFSQRVKKEIADATGQEFEIFNVEDIEAQIEATESVIHDLMMLQSTQIKGSEAFKITDNSIKTMTQDLEGLYKKAEEAHRIERVNDVMKELATTLANMGVDVLTSAFYELGRAMTNADEYGKGFAGTMAEVLKSVLDALPSLFIQAGIQILPDNLGLGLALIGMGISGAVISGMVSGSIEAAEGEAQKNNAQGGVYGYAKGGAFTNSVVDTPTYFTFSQGTGLMGEAGAEAIMPLTRTQSGELGVRAIGGNGGSAVSITVINNTGQEVETTERTSEDGKEIEIIIGNTFKKQLNNGNFDRDFQGRYGVTKRGYQR